MKLVAKGGTSTIWDDGDTWVTEKYQEGSSTIITRIPKKEEPHYVEGAILKWGFSYPSRWEAGIEK